VANLSMAQKQIAPTTIMVKTEIRTKIIAIPCSVDLHCSEFRGSILPVGQASQTACLSWRRPIPSSGPCVRVMTVHRPTPVGFSWGPVLTPDSIDRVFDGCHAFFHEDRPATGAHSAFRLSSNVVPRLDGAKK
jgi:hypothetical protein